MASSTKKSLAGRSFVTLLVVAVMAVGVFASGRLEAKEDSELVVGTYKPRQTFMQSPYQKKMRTEMQKAYKDAQKPMKKAKKKGNRKKMQEIQSDLRKKQKQMIDDFRKELEGVFPKVAKKAGVQIIAQGVKYTSKDVKTKDITDDLIKALGGTPKKTPKLKPKLKGGKGRMPKGKKPKK